jgi:DNA-binding transcriptional MocR family regulator
MPPTTTWTRPAGGYFVWVDLPPDTDVKALTDAARSHNLGFVPAAAFYVDPATSPPALRLAFSMYSPADLTEATSRLGAALLTPTDA